MTRQEFKTIDVLRLEVEDDPVPGALTNLIENPDGDLGGYGWVTPLPNTAISQAAAGGLDFRNTAAQATYFASEPLPCTAGRYVAARLDLTSRSAADVTIRARFVFRNSAGAVISSGAQTAAVGLGVLQVPAVVAPATTRYVQLRVDVYAAGGNALATTFVIFDSATVSTAATLAALGSYTSRKNLLAYGTSWETSAVGWPGYNGTLRAIVAGGYVGSKAIRFTATATTAQPAGAGAKRIATSGAGNDVNLNPIVPGQSYALQLRARGVTATPLRAELVATWYTTGNLVIGYPVSTYVVADTETITNAAWTQLAGVLVAPAGAAYMLLGVRATRLDGSIVAGDGYDLDAAMIEQAPAVAGWFDGDSAGASWDGTPGQSASTILTVVSSSLDYIPPVRWLSILGSAESVKVDRSPLDVGTLSVTLRDAQLDPSRADTIRPGKRCRLLVVDLGTGDFIEPLMTATIRKAHVTYDLRAEETKRARIELTATDNATVLASTPRSEGVATIAELPYVLEGAGVPWNVNGSGDQVLNAVVVARNDSASALDQVGITRDSSLGYAWVDRRNVLQAWDAGNIDPDAFAALLDETNYSDISIDYDTDRCINTVKVIFLRQTVTGETEEVTYGPYVDEDSVQAWGPHSATFTIQWQVEDAAQIAAFAGAILVANGTPTVRVNSVTMRITSPLDFDPTEESKRVLIELYDLVTVVNYSAGLYGAGQRVQRITHTITPKRWELELGFVPEGSVAAPSFAPTPGTGANGQTLGELLRPVGEVTMFYGTTAQVPAGWLVLNGASYSASTYPKLFALLGTTLLPDFNDRVPVGASTAKPLGSAGGSETITAAMLPPHAHTIAHGHPISTTSSATGTATGQVARGTATSSGDVTGPIAQPTNPNSGNGPGTSAVKLDPYRALHFIIRAA